MDTLAPELLEDILHSVYADIAPLELSNTLRNCSLVSHQWKQIAQPLLFSKFIVYGRQYNQTKLHQALLSYPHLRDLVKCIWVDLKALSNTPESDDKALIDLYHQLVSNPRFHHLIIMERQIDPRLFKTSSSLVSSSHLTALSFYEVRLFPIEIFYNCTSVYDIHIYRSNFNGFARDKDGCLIGDTGLNHPGKDPNRSRPRLLHLHLEAAYVDDIALIKWFLHADCAFDISDLRTFHLLDMSNELNSYTTARSFARTVSSSLESLALDPPIRFSLKEYYLSPDYGAFDPLPSLRCLKLSLQQDDFPKASLLPWAMQLLSGLSHPERLEELQLPCILTDYAPEGVHKDHGWEDFDLFLTASTPPTDDEPNGHRKFLNLNSVCLGAVVLSSKTDDVQRLQQIAEALPPMMPRLRDLGALKICFSTVIGFLDDLDCWYHTRSE